MPPTTVVRESFLAGELADLAASGGSGDWLDGAEEDFAAFVAERRGVRRRWGVPCTTYWYVSGEDYIGTLIVRHRLTPELAEVGGHVGYHVAPPGGGRAMPRGCWPRASPNAAASAWAVFC